MILSLYRAAMHLGRPLATAILRRRVAQGKEDALRLGERRGVAARPRPVTPRLIWIHAASVGESVSALPLINHILDDDPDAYLLLTTGTRTSAALMADRLPARASPICAGGSTGLDQTLPRPLAPVRRHFH